MIVQIKVRDNNGKYIEANSGDFASASLHQIIRSGGQPDSWWFLRLWLCKVLIQIVEKHSQHAETADRWYRRYQAIRAIE